MGDVLSHYTRKVAAGELTDDPAQHQAVEALDALAIALQTPERRSIFRKPLPPPKGLYLWGGVGRGKSMLMDLFVEHLDGVERRRVHFHAFMQEIHAALHKARKSGVGDAIAPVARDVIAQVKLLAFDEMQIADITDAMIVGRLFQALFDAGVVVVATSNRKPDDLYKNGLNRQLFLPFIELIKARMIVHELASPRDYRQDRLHGEDVYFTPLGPQSRARMDAIWRDLAPANDIEPLNLLVNGRAVDIPRFHNGVGRATFYELCGRPLGPADFLAIAEAVRVLLVDDIPALSRSNFNEAKRFVTLIDALYEAKVRLVASAAARPEMLYLEGEGSFEFERTASRLREMQAADWGE